MLKDTKYILEYYSLNPIIDAATSCYYPALTLPEFKGTGLCFLSEMPSGWMHTDNYAEGFLSLLAFLLSKRSSPRTTCRRTAYSEKK